MKTCKCGDKAIVLLQPNLDLHYKPSGTMTMGSHTELLCEACLDRERLRIFLEEPVGNQYVMDRVDEQKLKTRWTV